ncbi:MAG: response regulator, partial [Acidobacteriota bacterium]|nr:response regulator [Acidobacteriota bacterium]
MLPSPADIHPLIDAARILVVEDEAIIASHIAARLEKAGYEVVGILNSSTETMESLSGIDPGRLPDLILMDIRIKGPADGIDTALRVRDRFDIPVIFLTAHTDRETIDRAK